MIGDFNFGSTIVLVFEAPQSFRFKFNPGERVKYGQGLGDIIDFDHNTTKHTADLIH